MNEGIKEYGAIVFDISDNIITDIKYKEYKMKKLNLRLI